MFASQGLAFVPQSRTNSCARESQCSVNCGSESRQRPGGMRLRARSAQGFTRSSSLRSGDYVQILLPPNFQGQDASCCTKIRQVQHFIGASGLDFRRAIKTPLPDRSRAALSWILQCHSIQSSACSDTLCTQVLPCSKSKRKT